MRGLSLPNGDAECMVLLNIAFDYLELQEFKGARSCSAQLNSWPRSGIQMDGCELPADAVPQRIIDAQCQLAVDSQTVELMPMGSDRMVIRERIEGAVDTQYETTGVVPQPVKALAMLKPFLRHSGVQVGRV